MEGEREDLGAEGAGAGLFGADSRWALAWIDQYGFAEGDYGDAETLSKAKNTSVAGMVNAGILASQGGKVRLFAPEELPERLGPDRRRAADRVGSTRCASGRNARPRRCRTTALVQSWPEISRLARSAPAEQTALFDGE